MCGIFGLVRSPHDPDPQRASRVFAALGHLSEVRDRDASGFALATARGPVVVKAARPWSRVWHPRHLPAVDAARVALGHTRHATQGAPDVLANAAPLVVGAGLVGAV